MFLIYRNKNASWTWWKLSSFVQETMWDLIQNCRKTALLLNNVLSLTSETWKGERKIIICRWYAVKAGKPKRIKYVKQFNTWTSLKMKHALKMPRIQRISLDRIVVPTFCHLLLISKFSYAYVLLTSGNKHTNKK